MIKTYDFRMVRGETKILDFTVVDERGAAVDLTGATAYLRMRPDAKSDPVVSIISTGGSPQIVLLDQTATPTKGKFRATIAPADTHDLLIGTYVWDSWIVTASLDRFAVVGPSQCTLLQEVTTIPL